MPSYTVPIMPKASKDPTSKHMSAAPYPKTSTLTSAGPRPASIWSSSDDEKLLRARAAGLNWQPIASKYFPNKTPNACRKRHERLLEKRQIEDWDGDKLERLAQAYEKSREEVWRPLASQMGEKWQHVEAKCMEKGFKSLLATAAMAKRRATAGSSGSVDDLGSFEVHHSDSGSAFGSEPEIDVGHEAVSSTKAASWHCEDGMQETLHQEHSRSRSLPQSIPRPLPLYQPPLPPINTQHQRPFDGPMMTSPSTMSTGRPSAFPRYAPDYHNGRGGISIQAVLSPAEPQFA